MMKKGKAAGRTGIVSEMFTAEKDCSVEWLTSLCSVICTQWRIPDHWRSSILVVFKGKGDPKECGSFRAIVTGTCNESDRMCVRKKDQRESKD